MSVFIVPSTQAYHPFAGGHRHTSQPFHGGRRCGGGEMRFDVQSPFDAIANYSSRHQHPFFAQFVEEEEEDEEEQLAQYLRARYHQQQQQQQRQAAHILAARRQAEIERERERRRIQHQQIEQQRRRRAIALARAAWQEEQVRLHRLAIAKAQEEEQKRNLRKRQELAQKEWQEFASHGLATALQFAEWLGGLSDEEEESQPNDNKMEVDEKSQPTEDPVEVVPHPTTQVQVPISSSEDQDPPEEDLSKVAPVPIFSLPLPSNPTQRSSLKAEDIQVTFDEPTNTLQVRGLWEVNENENEDETVVLSSASSVTTNEDQEESRGRKRSRSPKRSRVSDVDETTGEEIVVEENTDGFVNVAAGKQPQGSARIPLPQGAKLSNLRAELTDEGFKLFI